jgi:hypothetical protein
MFQSTRDCVLELFQRSVKEAIAVRVPDWAERSKLKAEFQQYPSTRWATGSGRTQNTWRRPRGLRVGLNFMTLHLGRGTKM